MKTSAFKLPALACLTLAIGGLLNSCIDPYYANGNGPGPGSGRTYGSGYGSTSYSATYSPGYEVRSLPPGYRTERYGDRDYYQSGGHYYQRHANGYVVVEAPNGYRSGYNSGTRTQVITRLPSGYRTVQGRDGTYYRAGDSYYRREGSGYIIVEGPR